VEQRAVNVLADGVSVYLDRRIERAKSRRRSCGLHCDGYRLIWWESMQEHAQTLIWLHETEAERNEPNSHCHLRMEL